MRYEQEDLEDLNDNELLFEKKKAKKKRSNFRLVLLLFCFMVLITGIVKNDFSIDFFQAEASQFKPICTADSTYQASDDEELRTEKCKKAIALNREELKLLDAFDDVIFSNEPVGYKGKMMPVVKVYFNRANNESDKLPEKLCGFQLKALVR